MSMNTLELLTHDYRKAIFNPLEPTTSNHYEILLNPKDCLSTECLFSVFFNT